MLKFLMDRFFKVEVEVDPSKNLLFCSRHHVSCIVCVVRGQLKYRKKTKAKSLKTDLKLPKLTNPNLNNIIRGGGCSFHPPVPLKNIFIITICSKIPKSCS